MTKKLVVYWISTALLCIGMLGSGIAQLSRTSDMIELITPLGYPIYFLTIIGIWKVLAVAAILIPGYKLLKEWAYAGLFFVMTGALASHLMVGHPDLKSIAGPLMQSIFIILSWYFRPDNRKLNYESL